MKKLNLTPDLRFPLDLVTSTGVVYGGKGMGKTNLGGVIAEEIAAAGLRFSVIDPMGVWWGLQHGADRTTLGLPVLILGGVHGDLPIEPTGGAVVADLVADESVSAVIDISRRANGSMWTKGEKTRFVADYFARLYERQGEQRRPLLQLVDEAARFIPQMVPHGNPDVARCAGNIEQMVEEGRNLGVGVFLFTLRSARLSKSVAELADVMIAFRTVGPNSVGAIMDWLGEHVEKPRHKDLVEKLRTLPVGSAMVVSPGWLDFEGIVRFRKRHTFDSSETPRPGHIVRAPGKATKPDLAKYQARMAETVERAMANDPAALRREIAELKGQLLAKVPIQVHAPKAITKVQKITMPVVKDGQIRRLEVLVKTAHAAAGELGAAAASLGLRVVTGFDSTESPAVPGVERCWIVLECGHKRQYGTWFPGSGMKRRPEAIAYASKGDKVRCYQCPAGKSRRA